MSCPQCQLLNPVGTSYCARCGAPLETGPARAPMGAQVAAVGERKGMATTALALGILSPLLACVGIGFFTALAAVIVGSIAIVRVRQSPGVYGGKGSALAGTILGAVTLVGAVIVAATGIVASIAIPSLVRGRVSANEAATIGDIRSVISGEAAYQSANAGYYDTLECLGGPASCIPNYAGPAFLDAVLAGAAVKSGYRRTFHAGPPPDSPPATESRSPSSIRSFAYTAVPVQPKQSGVRGFCGDATGRICVTMAGSEPPVVNGECPQTCTTLN